MKGFRPTKYGNCGGGWAGPSVDADSLFGVDSFVGLAGVGLAGVGVVGVGVAASVGTAASTGAGASGTSGASCVGGMVAVAVSGEEERGDDSGRGENSGELWGACVSMVDVAKVRVLTGRMNRMGVCTREAEGALSGRNALINMAAGVLGC